MSKFRQTFDGVMRKVKSPKSARVISDAEEDATVVEQDPRSVMSSRLPSPRDITMDKLQKGYEQVVDLVGGIRSHLTQQSSRSSQMLTLMERLPDAIESLPEANRHQARMLEAIQDHLAKQGHANTELTQAVQGLAAKAEHQGRVMGEIQQQLDAQHQTSRELLTSFHSVHETLGSIQENNQASTQVLRQMAEHERESDTQMRELLQRHNRSTAWLSGASWLAAAAALSMAVWVGWSFTSADATGGSPAADAAASTHSFGSPNVALKGITGAPLDSRFSSRPAHSELPGPISATEHSAQPASIGGQTPMHADPPLETQRSMRSDAFTGSFFGATAVELAMRGLLGAPLPVDQLSAAAEAVSGESTDTATSDATPADRSSAKAHTSPLKGSTTREASATQPSVSTEKGPVASAR